MADYLVTDTELASIANAIRAKGGTSAALEFPTDFITAINNLVSFISARFTGNPITFNGAGGAAQSLSAAIQYQQDLHGYNSPNSPGFGVNKLPPCESKTQTEKDVTLVSYGDGTYRVYGTANGGNSIITFELTEPITIPENSYLHFCNNSANSSTALNLNSANGNIVNGVFTANRIMSLAGHDGEVATKLGVYVANGATVDVTFSPMICLDNTARSFSPYSNICPITAYSGMNIFATGENIFNITTSSGSAAGITFTMNGDGTVTVNGTSSAFAGKSMGSLSLKKGVSYFITGAVSNQVNAYFYRAGSGVLASDYGSGKLYTPDSDITVDFYLSVDRGKTINNLTISPMVVIGAEAKPFEAYSGSKYIFSFGAAGTVATGTLNVLTGELTVEKMVLTIDGNTIKANGKADYGTLTRYQIPWPSGISPNYTGASSFCISDKLTPSYECTIGITATKPEGAYVFPHSSKLYVSFPASSFSSISDANTWFASNTPSVGFELATPLTYNLTPAQVYVLLGKNNVWSDINGNITIDVNISA